MADDKKAKTPDPKPARPPRDDAELAGGPVEVVSGKRPPRDDAELAALLKGVAR